jgi:hypothetical protein
MIRSPGPGGCDRTYLVGRLRERYRVRERDRVAIFAANRWERLTEPVLVIGSPQARAPPTLAIIILI